MRPRRRGMAFFAGCEWRARFRHPVCVIAIREGSIADERPSERCGTAGKVTARFCGGKRRCGHLLAANRHTKHGSPVRKTNEEYGVPVADSSPDSSRQPRARQLPAPRAQALEARIPLVRFQLAQPQARRGSEPRPARPQARLPLSYSRVKGWRCFFADKPTRLCLRSEQTSNAPYSPSGTTTEPRLSAPAKVAERSLPNNPLKR